MTAWNDDSHDVLDELIRRVEEAWQSGREPELSQFVPAVGDPARQQALRALIQTDQELRWQHGQRKTVEQYLTEWPELRNLPECEAELRAWEEGVQMESRLGRYEIRAELGRGGMGRVYRAFDTQLEREVALKIPSCDPQRERAVVERFLQEGKAAARIQHPNVCPIYDAGCSSGTYFLVMALIDGESLAEWRQNRSPSPEASAEMIRKLALALQVVHDQGIVHRDIKPSNVMVTRQGEPLLMDFGLARCLDGGGGHTVSGALVGTVPYMSPEQVNGAPADRLSDVYSLGVVFYELLAGELPFQGKLTDLLLRIGQAQPAKPSRLRPGLDPRLEAICLKAMAKKPEERYQSAAELAAALQTREPPGDKPAERWRRRSLAFGGGVLLASALLAVAAFWHPPGQSPDPPTDPPLPRLLKTEFLLQRRDSGETGTYEQMSDKSFPLRTGDKFQWEIELDQEAFVYMYWFDGEGKPTRLYPPNVSREKQRRARQVLVPPGADAGKKAKWWPLADLRGAETIFVAVSPTVCDEEVLARLETAYRAPSRLGPGMRLAAFAHPATPVAYERGPGSVVTSPKLRDETLKELTSVLERHFSDYRGWILANE